MFRNSIIDLGGALDPVHDVFLEDGQFYFLNLGWRQTVSKDPRQRHEWRRGKGNTETPSLNIINVILNINMNNTII